MQQSHIPRVTRSRSETAPCTLHVFSKRYAKGLRPLLFLSQRHPQNNLAHASTRRCIDHSTGRMQITRHQHLSQQQAVGQVHGSAGGVQDWARHPSHLQTDLPAASSTNPWCSNPHLRIISYKRRASHRKAGQLHTPCPCHPQIPLHQTACART